MKCLLLIVFTAIYIQSGAQQPNTETQQKLQAFIDKQKDKQGLLYKTDTAILLPRKNIGSLANKKPGVYALPLDGMPCIVPYTGDIVAIPNAMPQKQVVPFGKIPNATPQTGEQLRRNQRQFFAPPSR